MKLNKKGFTLIEVIAVIAILALIFGLSSPTIVNIITNSRNKAKQLSFKNIKSSAVLYTKENSSDISWVPSASSTEYTCVNINKLISDGILKEENLENLDLGSGEGEYDNYTVKITRNSIKAITKEEITEISTCNTSLDLNIDSITTTSTTININNVTCTKDGNNIDNITFSLDNSSFIGGTKSNHKHTKQYTGLNANTIHNYKVQCIDPNDSNNLIIKSGNAFTADFGTIDISLKPDTCSSEAKEITLTTPTSNDIYYKLPGGSWTKYNSKSKPKLETNGIISASYYINKKYTNITTKTVTNIDNRNITILKSSVSPISLTTATINYEQEQTSSCSTPIYTYTCEYGTTTSYGKSVTGTEDKCNIKNLTSGTKYYYKITITDEEGNKDTKIGNFKTHTKPEIKTIDNPSNGEWTNETITLSVHIADTTPITSIKYSYDKTNWTSLSLKNYDSKTGIYKGDWTKERNATVYFKVKNKDGEESDIKSTTVKIDKTPPTYTVKLKQGSSTKDTYNVTKYETFEYKTELMGTVDVAISDAKDTAGPNNTTVGNTNSGLNNDYILSWNSWNLEKYDDTLKGYEDRTLTKGKDTRTISSYGKRMILLQIFDLAGNVTEAILKIPIKDPNINGDRFICNEKNKELSIYHVTICPDAKTCNYDKLNGLTNNKSLDFRNNLRTTINDKCITTKKVCSSSGLNCRSGASTSGTKVEKILSYNTSVKVAKTTTPSWYYSTTYNCYVNSSYLEDSCPVYTGGSSSGGGYSGGGSSYGGDYSGGGNSSGGGSSSGGTISTCDTINARCRSVAARSCNHNGYTGCESCADYAFSCNKKTTDNSSNKSYKNCDNFGTLGGWGVGCYH